MEPLETRSPGAQVQGKRKANTDDLSLGKKGVTLRPAHSTPGYHSLGDIAPYSFRRPGLGILHLELPASINNLDSRIHGGDLLNRVFTDGTQDQYIHSLHQVRILREAISSPALLLPLFSS